MSDKEESILQRLGVGIGYKTSHTKTITEADVASFASVSGDFNPVHVDEEFARKTMFQGRIAHGILSVALISAAVAKLPGLCIIMSHSSRFLKPVRIGDTITATAEVIGMRDDKGIVTLKNVCTNQKGEVVIDGETVAKLFEI